MRKHKCKSPRSRTTALHQNSHPSMEPWPGLEQGASGHDQEQSERCGGGNLSQLIHHSRSQCLSSLTRCINLLTWPACTCQQGTCNTSHSLAAHPPLWLLPHLRILGPSSRFCSRPQTSLWGPSLSTWRSRPCSPPSSQLTTRTCLQTLVGEWHISHIAPQIFLITLRFFHIG